MVTQEVNCIDYIVFGDVETIHPVNKSWFDHANRIFTDTFFFHGLHKSCSREVNHAAVLMADD